MSDQPTEATDKEALRKKADERNESMPAETALGNRDPRGGGEGDPEDFKGDQN